jgi:hypothetical protein
MSYKCKTRGGLVSDAKQLWCHRLSGKGHHIPVLRLSAHVLWPW